MEEYYTVLLERTIENPFTLLYQVLYFQFFPILVPEPHTLNEV